MNAELPCPAELDPRRIVVLRGGPPRPAGRFVLYFCQVSKRAEWHPGLHYAAFWADQLGVPLVVYEGLRRDYPHASWRHHRFILDGVHELGERLAQRGIAHYFYLQRATEPRAPIVAAVAEQAALVVTDDYPAFLVPRHNAALAVQLDCPLYAVDSVGIAPLRAFPERLIGAYSLRPRLHRMLPDLLESPEPYLQPKRDSLSLRLTLPPGVVRSHTLPRGDDSAALDALVKECGVDMTVRPAPQIRGGRQAGLQRWQHFQRELLPAYAEGRNRAAVDVTSNLSPYLHYGMLSVEEIARAAVAHSPSGLANPNVAAYVEELLVRRELAHNFCLYTPLHQSLAALPPWARDNLMHHQSDPRPVVYDLPTLEGATTSDPLWNGVQRELRDLGEPHGYLRMLWGKKIIEWAPTYQLALQWMIFLNDKYAYDGRDAISYTNILWCFGLHDRPFPRRPIFGLMRPMSSASTGKKTGAAEYLARQQRQAESGPKGPPRQTSLPGLAGIG